MRVVIDLQGAQSTGSRNRGIGRYSTSLAKAILETRGEHDVHLLLNGAFVNTIDPIRREFKELLPDVNIHVWHPATPACAASSENGFRRKASEKIRESVIERISADAVLITSLFEGFGDDAVLSIGEFSRNIPTAVVIYDLIPLIHRNIYLANPDIERWYLQVIDQIRRAKHLLSISASSGREAVNFLGFSESAVTNISTACDSHFVPKLVSERRRGELAGTYGITKPFVMYTGGIDHRKNIEGLIRAYAALPGALRATHQLAVVCSVQPTERQRLQVLAAECGLDSAEFVMTGFVPENDLLDIYNSCKAFIFPSWHEGFGLPALEAMACGRAVIGANTSSVPEVIGREDALFDPLDDAAITAALHRVLTDDAFRADLEAHGLMQAQKFSWMESARTAWSALETLPNPATTHAALADQRPRLAYVSPVPVAKSGIADYSAELLPELSRHYRIDIIVNQDEPVQEAWIQSNYTLRDVAWLRSHPDQYDRVLYHFGNSHFHAHMFDLLEEIPGTVVLHDFFLSGIVAHMDVTGQQPGSWARSLLQSHGWPAVISRYTVRDTAETVWQYPANLRVLQMAQGVIVHSINSQRLAEDWYGRGAADDWVHIPHMRVPVLSPDKAKARRELGIPENAFVVCSFGLLGRTKLNQRLLAAWLQSPLARDSSCRLVFVGQNEGGAYGAEMERAIREAAGCIEITGWADAEAYKRWLSAADAAVQLRTLSRGETSGTVLDCMNYALPTIVNAHGAMRDISEDVVLKLPDEFSDDELVQALTRLWRDAQGRVALGRRARLQIEQEHQPRACADQYFRAIENFHRTARKGALGLVQALHPASQRDAEDLAKALVLNFPPVTRLPTLYLDISELVVRDAKSGIQRVVRSILMEYLQNPPAGWLVEPVYATSHEPGYRSARRFACGLLGLPADWAQDAQVEVAPGDRFLALDLQPQVLPAQLAVLRKWRAQGVHVQAVVYDLLPVLLPQYFVAGAAEGHRRWLETVSELDGIVAISKAVADEFIQWLEAMGPRKRELPISVDYFHHGADLEASLPTSDESSEGEALLASMAQQPSLLMVGTLEPRKGHAAVLDAMERLWEEERSVQLVIVGKQGWMVDELVARLRQHSELERRLHWLENASDVFLTKIYSKAAALVAASEGEGFGLPLIEAARHGLAIIARDIPVFREVAGEYAAYFPAENDAGELAAYLGGWLDQFAAGRHVHSNDMPWLTWRESAAQLQAVLDGRRSYRQWLPDGHLRYWGNDLRMHTQVGRRHGVDMHTTGQEGFLVFGPYGTLEPGHYLITLSGRAKAWSGHEWFDIACSKGCEQLLFARLEGLPTSDWQKTMEFDLRHSVVDFEARLWVGAESHFSLACMKFVKVLKDDSVISASVPAGSLPAVHTEAGYSSGEVDSLIAGVKGVAEILKIEEEPFDDAQMSAVLSQSLFDDSGLASDEKIQPNLIKEKNFAVIGDSSNQLSALQSEQDELISDHAQLSNGVSVLSAKVMPSELTTKWQISAAERNRPKAQRKKKR